MHQRNIFAGSRLFVNQEYQITLFLSINTPIVINTHLIARSFKRANVLETGEQVI